MSSTHVDLSFDVCKQRQAAQICKEHVFRGCNHLTHAKHCEVLQHSQADRGWNLGPVRMQVSTSTEVS